MALVNCPECGRENVSDSAESCPSCGYNIKGHFEQIKMKEKEENEKEQILLMCKSCTNMRYTTRSAFQKNKGNRCHVEGAETFIIMTKKEFESHSDEERQRIVEENIKKVKNMPSFDEKMYNKYKNIIRIDQNYEMYCPKCGSTVPLEIHSTIYTKCSSCNTPLLSTNIQENDFDLIELELMEKYNFSIFEANLKILKEKSLIDKDTEDKIKEFRRINYKPVKIVEKIVECPYCHSTDTKKISGLSKATKLAFWGALAIGSTTKQWHCNSCNSDF